MKIFPKKFVSILYRFEGSPKFFEVLKDWANYVSYTNSPILRQVASYHLRDFGFSNAPRDIKQDLGNYIFESIGVDDFTQTILLAGVEGVRGYDSSRGNCSLVNYLSWYIPYRVSRLTAWVIKPNITYLEDMYSHYGEEDLETFVCTSFRKRNFDILCADIGASKQLKYFYAERDKIV